MIECELLNVKIKIDIGFLAVIAVLSMTGKYSLYAFAACMIHESGHILPGLIFGYHIKSIICSITGIEIHSVPGKIHSFKDDLIILSGGITANLITAAVLYISGNTVFAAVNAASALISLLPFSVLDGGSLVRSTSEAFLKDDLREKVCFLSGIMAVMISFAAFFKFGKIILYNPSAMIFWIYITGSEIYRIAASLTGI